MIENLTREQIMTASVKHHVAYKKYTHEAWLNRQAEYQRIRNQDCYGVQKRNDRTPVKLGGRK